VDFIKSREGESVFRIWGADQRIVHPNLAGTFGLSDLRDQTPLYIREYVELISSINGWQTDEEAASNFLGEGKFYFDLDWDELPPRILDLLNVRYVMAFHEPGLKPAVREGEDLKELIATAPDHVVRGELTIGDKMRDGFIMHAPSLVRTGITPGRKGLIRLEGGVLPKAAACADTDGVSLNLIRRVGPLKRLVFARTVHAKRDRSWNPARFGSGATGSELVFASLPGPRGDPRCDFGAFSMPMVQDKPGGGVAGHHLELIYDREFKVYENMDVLPRVFPVQEVFRGESMQSFMAFAWSRDPDRTASIIETGGSGVERFAPAEISGVEEGFGRITFRADSGGHAFAVISNLYYPGFFARINGSEERIYKVDGALQGVKLPPGESEVMIAFAPASFRIGIWYHIATIAFVIATLIVSRRQKASRP
jgi:hypothetical protein